MRDPLSCIETLAEKARGERPPAVDTARLVLASLRSEPQPNDRILPWMAAASAAVAAAMSAQLFTIVRALSNPLAALFHMSATLLP